ncbi:hypothetical protein [Longimicrobium sp.]|uniref:hypothetical protein n=1 Tax=Longimicrobium sp. TaxID=2029185 RepID=UPI002E339280|nr:hypothetical protein [Longimicrobium sp.]HEX6037205.1 hypothetical protein [Longimicrobium sp.]
MKLAVCIALALLSAAACAPGVRGGPAPAPGTVRVALVDSVPFSTELEDGWLPHVEVRTPAGADTLADVLTAAEPVVLPDGRVLGFAWDGPDLRAAFAYDPARRRLRWMELPDDADRLFTLPAFSPDGRHLAYVAYDTEHGVAWGMVRRDVRGPVLVRTMSVPVPATDAAMNFVEWMDAETFAIHVDVGADGWHRFRGTVSAGVTAQDTVRVSDVAPGT